MTLFIAQDTDSTFTVRPGENTLQAAVYAISGCAVRYKNTSLAGLTLDGANGDIVPY